MNGERPGGTRAIDRQIAEILGWRELVEIKGMIDLAGIPPGGTKAEPVPMFSSIAIRESLARLIDDAEVAIGRRLWPLPDNEPWNICQKIIEEANSLKGNQ